MKNWLFLLLFVALSVGAGAQTTTVVPQNYKIAISGIPSNQPTFNCKVVPITLPNTETPRVWTHGDLITWIFPDGQMMQREIVIAGNAISNDTVNWSPCCSLTVKINEVQAHVAKKGGTGPPPMAMHLTTPASEVTGTTLTPVAIDFSTGKHWKVSSTWEFSPGKDNFLVISYKGTADCKSNGEVVIALPAGITMIDSMIFNDEYIKTVSNGNKGVEMPSIPATNRSVFLKLHTADSVTIGRHFDIIISPRICGNLELDTIQYVFRGEPHDPNYKIVDIQEIPLDQPDSLKLTYTIQFHNIGEGPVKFVTVIDTLPKELDPATFALLYPPVMNGLTFNTLETSPTNPYVKIMTFKGANGLPGLNQKGKSYAFDETIYRFSFTVKSIPSVQTAINNYATVLFHTSDGDTLPAVITGIAQVSLAKGRVINDPKTDTSNWTTCLLAGLLALFAIFGFYFFRRHKTNKP